jgi:hypothetical protein
VGEGAAHGVVDVLPLYDTQKLRPRA